MSLIAWRKWYAGLAGQGDTKDVAAVVQHITNTTITNISSLPGIINLDRVENGTTYAKLLLTETSAGHVKLTSSGVYDTGYDPSSKRRVFTATPTTPYDVGDLWLDASVVKRCTTARASGAYTAADWTATTLDAIGDGTTYSKVLTTDITSGHILLSSVTQSASYRTVTDTLIGTWNGKPDDLDELGEGTTYKRVLATEISSGRLSLTATNYYSGKFSGEWYSMGAASGVDIDATHGINLYGPGVALTTRATKTGTIQCYVGADGKIYAGAGAVYLDANGVSFTGVVGMLSFYVSTVLHGVIQSITLSDWNRFAILAQNNIDLFLQGESIYLYTEDGGITLNAGGVTYGDILLQAGDDILLVPEGDLKVAVSGGATQIVTKGAADSGGAGYSLLRVPN